MLILPPPISLASLKQLTVAGNVNMAYAEALYQFARRKLTFCRLQKLNVTLSCLLLVMVIILLPQFFGSKEVANSKSFRLFAFTIGICSFCSFLNEYQRTIKIPPGEQKICCSNWKRSDIIDKIRLRLLVHKTALNVSTAECKMANESKAGFRFAI